MKSVYGGDCRQYATVKKLLERLECKGFAKRDRRELRHVFAATIDRLDLVFCYLGDLSRDIGGGSIVPLLMYAAEHPTLTRRQRSELKKLIRELDGAVI